MEYLILKVGKQFQNGTTPVKKTPINLLYLWVFPIQTLTFLIARFSQNKLTGIFRIGKILAKRSLLS